MYLYIFLQSNLLEVPFYYLFFKSKKTFLQNLVLTTAINSLTHPIVFFVIMNMKCTYLTNILIAESFAILIEGLYFWKVAGFTFKKSYAAAAIANLVSWQLAPMLTYILFKN